MQLTERRSVNNVIYMNSYVTIRNKMLCSFV